MTKFLRQAWTEIRQGENIDLYLTIVAAIVVSGLSLAGVQFSNQIPAITLAILALLAITNLVNRHKIEEIIKREGTFLRKEFPEEVKLEIEKAKEVWLVGFRLSRTLITYIAILDKKLARGEKVKVIILDPESQAVQYSNQTLSYSMQLEQFRESIRTSLNMLKNLKNGNNANLEIRVIDYPLPFGMYGINIDDAGGKMYIKQYEYQAKTDGIKFILTPKDGTWYDIYHQQLMSLWKDARPMQRTGKRSRTV